MCIYIYFKAQVQSDKLIVSEKKKLKTMSKFNGLHSTTTKIKNENKTETNIKQYKLR